MSLQTIAKITLDFYNKNMVCINAKQYDSARIVEITCSDRGLLFAPDKNAISAFVRLRKPDSLGVFNLCEINDEGKILVELTEQTLAAPGKAIADVFLIEKVFTSGEKPIDIDDISKINAPVLSTMNFTVNITPTALEHSQIESSYEFNALTNALAQIDYNNKKVEVLDKTLTDNENQRIENENIRKENETNRVSAENKRQTDTADAIKKANDFIFRADGALNTINQKAQEVQTNANNAKTSEANAKLSEDNSSIYEKNSKTYMENAFISATTASSKADEASASAESASKSENVISVKASEINQKANDIETIKSDVQNIASDVSDMRDAVSEDKTTIEDTIKNSLLASSEEILAAMKGYYDRAQELYNSMYIDCDGETPQQRVVTIVSIDCGTPQSRLHDTNGILFNGGTPLNRQLAS